MVDHPGPRHKRVVRIVDKTDPKLRAYCVTCIHRDSAGDRFPCNCCVPYGILHWSHKFEIEGEEMPLPDRYSIEAVMQQLGVSGDVARRIVIGRQLKDKIRKANTFSELREALREVAEHLFPEDPNV